MKKKIKNILKSKTLGGDNISYKNNFIFIHVPKNAGTSVSKGLDIKVSYHNTVQEYVQLLGEKKYKDMFSFAFVRNPFSRFISLYNYARLEESYYHSSINPDKAMYGKHMDYELLKDASVEEAAHFLIEGKLVHNPPHIQWLPQCFWLKNTLGELNVTYLGRFEDIDFHLRNIYRIIGIPITQSLNKINASTTDSIPYTALINASTRKILEEFYKEDLEEFNYTF